MRYGFLFIVLLITGTACNTLHICDDFNESLAVVRLKTIYKGEIRDTIVSGIDIWGIRDGQNGQLFYDSTTASRIVLPLDPSSTESSFIIRSGELSDTLVLVHDSEAYLINYECGFAMRYLITEVQSTLRWTKDTELIDGEIDAETLSNEEHIRIYF